VTPSEAQDQATAARSPITDLPEPDPPAADTSGSTPPLTEMTAFIRELDEAPNVDPDMRREILAMASQASPELQTQLIRQYRALLSLGRPAANDVQAGGQVARQPSTERSYEPPITSVSSSTVPAQHTAPVAPEPPPADEVADLKEQLAEFLARSEKMQTPDAETARATSNTDSRSATDTTWNEHVDAAIEQLREELEIAVDGSGQIEDEARLRLLYLIANRRDAAVEAIESLDPEMQEFWSKEIFGLATLLSPELIADPSNRLVESKRNLNDALLRLGESAPLAVRNLAFVTEVQAYGSYTPFGENEFLPGQRVLLYGEVENFRSKQTAQGYHTALRSSYEIFDSRRQKIAEHEFNTNEETCRNPRRDFFTICEFTMPDRLYPGRYELRLTVADLNGDKSGQSSITFHVRERGE